MCASIQPRSSPPIPALGNPIRVLLVDDHTLFRRGIASLLEPQPDIEVVGESCDGMAALEDARRLHPDLILMDIKMPALDGIAATRAIRKEIPSIRIVALTVSEDEEDLFQIIKNGAQGYLLKNLEPEDLTGAIRGAFRGEATISPLMARKMLREFSRQVNAKEQPVFTHLTEREQEVLRMISKGATNTEISRRLCISESTARNHVHNILEKLHLRNRVQAAIYAIDHGFNVENDANHTEESANG